MLQCIEQRERERVGESELELGTQLVEMFSCGILVSIV